MLDQVWDRLWVNVRLATMRERQANYGVVENGAIAVKGPYITYAGSMADLPARPELCAHQLIDGERLWVTPGLIDCHTHLVYAGNRAHEFEMRLEGASLEQIARSGGGMRSTIQATRRASEDELLKASAPRLEQMLQYGVTTVEIKSGYGLETEAELRQLRVARRLETLYPVSVRTAFLGAHAIPTEFDGQPDRYLDLIIEDMLPRVAAEQLAETVDCFMEQFAFDHKQTQRLFKAAERYGFDRVLHADQLTDSEGAALAAHYECLAAAHLEHASEDGVGAMARAGTVAVLLPGSFYFLRERNLPPIHELRMFGGRMAVATDCNPGSAPLTSILTAMNFACVLFRLTPQEALAGVTREAAHALGMARTHGTLDIGKVADLCFWDVNRPGELAYALGAAPLVSVVKEGVTVR